MLKRLRSSRQLLFVTFAALLALAVNIPWIAGAQHLPWYGFLICLIFGWGLIAFVMRWNWKRIEEKDNEIEREEKRKTQEEIGTLRQETREEARTAINQIVNKANKELADALSQAISQTLKTALEKQTEAIVAALQKNSETIIKAIREPLDGHE